MRFWGQRFSLLLLIAVAIGLLIFSRTDTDTVDRVEAVAHDAGAPLLDMLSRPIDGLQSLIGSLRSLVDLQAENESLKEEMQRLRGWEAVARRLDHENQVLRSFLNAKTEGLGPVIAGRVIGDAGGPYVRAVLVNAGSQQGVAKGQAVTDGRYVIGQVITAGRLSARILLITDLNSRVPVMIERSGDRAILAGDNSPLPSLKFLPVGAELQEGDRILTSGDGGVFPARLPVGEAVITPDGLKIRPLVDFARLEYALILDYHFPELREPVEEGPALEVAAP